MACAAWALGESGVDLVDASVAWEGLAASGEDVVLHDALCPMTPPAFIAACVRRARETGRPVVGVRPVTDTIKVVVDGFVGVTVDRDGLLAITSPLVIPATVVAGLAGISPDLARAVTELTDAGHGVETLEAPAEGRRVASTEEVRLLEALTDPRG